MVTVLTPEQIESVIQAIPLQGRIMLRLLLIQYLDITQEDIEYMAADRPDPRFQAGMKAQNPIISRETVQGIADRTAQYRSQVRQKRERIWLQRECLRKLIARTESFAALVERLLISQFGLSAESIQDLKTHARSAILKPVLRELDARWDENEMPEDEYRRKRLSVEYQTQLKRLDRERKRLEIANREYDITSCAPLQDHEVAHVWGIPAGSLAARKAKYLQQYLQGIQAKVREITPPNAQASVPTINLWKETFVALSQRPVERSVAIYDGLEGTEGSLLEKLDAFASGTLSEDMESRFWQVLTQDSNPAAEHGSKDKSLFALQRLIAILNDMDMSTEGLEQELLARISPTPKVIAGELEEKKPSDAQLGEMGEHVLRSFMGEERQ
jgi:hypothetical protein